MKIKDYKLDFSKGKIVEEQQDVKVENYTRADALQFIRNFLNAEGYKDVLGSKSTITRTGEMMQMLTFYGKVCKASFVTWKHNKSKPIETGKGTFWIGERNLKPDYLDIVIGDRVIRKDAEWVFLIVVPKEFKIGMTTKNVGFLKILLVPMNLFIDFAERTNKFDMDFHIDFVNEFEFPKTLEILRDEN